MINVQIRLFLFREVFSCPGKTFASIISSLFRPPLATFHKRNEITQKYNSNCWISRDTDCFGHEGLIFIYVSFINSTVSIYKYLYFLNSPLVACYNDFVSVELVGRSRPHLSDGNFGKNERKSAFYLTYPRLYRDKKMHWLLLMTIRKYKKTCSAKLDRFTLQRGPMAFCEASINLKTCLQIFCTNYELRSLSFFGFEMNWNKKFPDFTEINRK